MRVILFGLTGFGNSALRAAKSAGAEVVALITRHEKGVFPYYPERNLSEEARDSTISIYENLDLTSEPTLFLLRDLRPDLILSSSFHQKLPARLYQMPSKGAINIHPSLLPAYRGATPTNWCLMNGETVTGITAHYLSEEIDGGPIIYQEKTTVHWSDTNGTLRFKLAQLTQNLVGNLLAKLLVNEDCKAIPQDQSRMSYYPKWSKKDALIVFNQPVEQIFRRIRASLPYPAPYTTLHEQKILIQDALIPPESRRISDHGRILEYNSGWLTVAARDGLIKIRSGSEINFQNADVLGE